MSRPSNLPLKKRRNKRRSKSKPFRFRCLMLLLPIMLWFSYKEIKDRLEQPQAILVLGGSEQREKFAAEFALQHPDIPIWVSGGAPRGYTERLYAKVGVELNRLHLDYRAVDTVTNFTTLVDRFKARGINKIYLVTSDYHMRRARTIGEIVLGSRGIDFKPVSVPSERSPEPIEKTIRDGARALFWVATGHTGSTLIDKDREQGAGSRE